MKTIFILNGPPNSGKDTLASFMTVKYGAQWLQFKDKLFELAMSISNIDNYTWYERYNNRQLKDAPWDMLGNLSQREFLIKISEEWVKPIFGKDYFGKMSKHKIDEISSTPTFVPKNIFVFSDGGFIEEINALKDDDTQIIIIHLYRTNTSFNNDSRTYITINGCEHEELYNIHDLEVLFKNTSDIVNTYI